MQLLVVGCQTQGRGTGGFSGFLKIGKPWRSAFSKGPKTAGKRAHTGENNARNAGYTGPACGAAGAACGASYPKQRWLCLDFARRATQVFSHWHRTICSYLRASTIAGDHGLSSGHPRTHARRVALTLTPRCAALTLQTEYYYTECLGHRVHTRPSRSPRPYCKTSSCKRCELNSKSTR
jgi:hypothetical protein